MTMIFKPELALRSLFAITLMMPVAHADSIANLSEATADSSEASARIVAAGGQVVLGAVALPLAITGSAANASGTALNESSEVMWDAANTPLRVDDRIAIAQPLPRIPRLPETASSRSDEK